MEERLLALTPTTATLLLLSMSAPTLPTLANCTLGVLMVASLLNLATALVELRLSGNLSGMSEA